MGSKETPIQRSIRLELGRETELVLWRNNVGFASAEKVRYGLCKGSFDLIGIYRGRFCALEVKAQGGRLSKEQLQFAHLVAARGGLVGMARSAKEARAVLARWEQETR